MRSTRCTRSAAGRRDQISICGIHLPKIKRPISSPSCFTSSGSAAARKRSAKAKNAFSFSLCASRPCSTSSTSTRLSLRRLFLAILSTCSASRVGKVTLLRTCFVDAISPVYTVMVHSCRGPHGRLYYNKRMTEGHGDGIGFGAPEHFSLPRRRYMYPLSPVQYPSVPRGNLVPVTVSL